VKKSGFTLIELLVVISIIGLLSSIVLASLNETRAKSRDSERKQELHQIVVALNLYYSKHGIFPDFSSGIDSSDPAWLQPLVNDADIAASPRDPINANTGAKCAGGAPTGPSQNSLFTLRSHQSWYVLCALLETEPTYLADHDTWSVMYNNLQNLYADLHYPSNAYIIQEPK